ncbi:gephyrin-like molybdotransferase Glp [Bacillus sp. 03113]|uniref:molybdopterin molybdotransferase MoeA n=1 Tax=Bacillus sp. 03113 TaxID=2578211 RepID=UPI002852F13C|nr:gephyrin-like molybdotransferase Glp [Bacillus sp. 03113]
MIKLLTKRTPLSVPEAIQKVMNYKKKGNIEYISIHHSFQRFLAEDVIATHDVPHFDRSPYDGFAVRSIDTVEANLDLPVEFEVIDSIGAGSVTKKTVGPFQAVRIMTGAKLPEECDAVVMLELAQTYTKNENNYMSIKRSYKKGDNVSFRGEDIKKGEVIVRKGTYINPGIQAILATFGYHQVPVARKPIIGIYATGSELLDVEDSLQPGKIRNSNSYMLLAQIERAGGEARYFGKLPDDVDICFESISKAINEVDFFITTGGVSVGDYDYMPDIYQRLEAEVLFNKVAMRPGSVTTVAQTKESVLFGLSGNPSACYVGFELFVRPLIRTMLFSSQPHLQKECAILGSDFPKPNPFTRFVRSKVSIMNGKLYANPSGKDKSNMVTSLVGANAFMILPGGTRGYKEGDEVDVLILDNQEGCEWSW